MLRRCAPLLAFVLFPAVALAQGALTESEVAEAIELGKKGEVPVLRVTTFLGDFDVFVEGPIARVAAAAMAASRDFRPFDASNVTREMASRLYVVRARPKRYGRRVGAGRIVLQPRGAEGMDGVVQPVKEGFSETTFDRLPDGEFQVVVVTEQGPQRYTVTEKDRPKIH
jgi:hypothetical protein